MHARRKGVARSKKPLLAPIPTWVEYKPEEIEALVTKLAKQGYNSAQIGTMLRDSYGVPEVKKITGKKIAAIMAENKLLGDVPEDIQALLKSAIQAKKHFDKNKKDIHSKHGLQLIESKIRRLVKYYKREGKLPPKWNYSLVG